MEAIPHPKTFFGNLSIAVYQIAVKLDHPSRQEAAPTAPNCAAAQAAASPIQSSMYWGSAWRGLLGWELQRLLCPFPKRPQCKQCLIRESCPYFRLMEDQSNVSGIQEMPRGYVLYPTVNGSNDSLQLYLTLFGTFIRYAPAVLKALQCGETTGIGASRTPYRLMGISEILPKEPAKTIALDFDGVMDFGCGAPLADWVPKDIAAHQAISCRLATPVRLRRKGKYLGQMDWPYFFASLIRRIESLELLFASGKPLGKERFVKLAAQFSGLHPKSESLAWHEYSRWSNRQHKKVPMGGLVGDAAFDDSCQWLYPWLALAEIVHVGKGASMGLGKIETGTSSHGSSP
ncbi:CRISPR system precrRNA processing endoribonuclease RAMP protein Cas6 [Desulfatirhabdium butyrativorans]|uniref:CRISPR system precrRNA processing endoribonuclease RAMP protein Cas6 n=1 Tax=Desulfatirhabdium butyrativorans TaxID=340467 RepID=UPI00040AE017|nr:CRISPR system precrRNA processing endoribonuclease RAMP protein Cas6 [Desulfatirhabdium butyrativorans]